MNEQANECLFLYFPWTGFFSEAGATIACSLCVHRQILILILKMPGKDANWPSWKLCLLGVGGTLTGIPYQSSV